MSPSKNCELFANELEGIAYRGRAENSSDTDKLIEFRLEQFGRVDSLFDSCRWPTKGRPFGDIRR